MEPISIQKLSAPKGEFFEPPPSSKQITTSFSGDDNENPYHHLREFRQLCSCLVITGMTQETIKWKLFPFSLTEWAKQWYAHTVGSLNGDWEGLRDKFCLAFFPLSRIKHSLRKEILGFQQYEKESIGAAWARFSDLVHSCQDLCLPNEFLLHFYLGLEMESAPYLDITTEGSFTHKTMMEGKYILDRILDNTSPILETKPL
jgi:hypothetical protein